MKVLGLDLGLKRTGMAISDETGTVVRRLSNLVCESRQKAVEEILRLVMNEDVGVVVIGHPSGPSESAIAKRAVGLKEALMNAFLEKEISALVTLWDERKTSQKAAENLAKNQIQKSKRKDLLDAESAAVLVEDYLLWAKK